MDSEWVTCPYNPEHKLLRYRMPSHLIKCVKNYKGEPLQRCAFNAMHLIPPARMPTHLKEECYEYYLSRKEEYERQNKPVRQE